jgi:small-conductance mechanosensitive channel
MEICYRVLNDVPEVIKDPKQIIGIDDFKEQYVKISILVWFSIDKFSNGCNKVKKLLAEEFNKKNLKASVIRTKEIPNDSQMVKK